MTSDANTDVTDRVFSPSIYGPSAKRAGHKSKGKRGSVTYSTDRENEVSKIFIITAVCPTGSGTISIHAERLRRASKGKRGSVTYSTDRENEVSKIFIITAVCPTGSGTISIHAERLQISDAPR